MDHELKQRIIGAVVVTALAAIFIPMLFDDPVDNSGNAVKELAIPQAPAETSSQVSQNLPADKTQVMNRQDIELNATEVNEEGMSPTMGDETALDTQDGGQSEQLKSTDTMAGADPGMSENDLEEDNTSKHTGQSDDTGLDTGIVHEANQSEGKVNEAVSPQVETLKKPSKNLEKTSEPTIVKPDATEKPKAKSVISEKAKVVDKAQKSSTTKSGSKLVRYSIQAGSFNKKENAQALVEKLRKQGLPASIVSKGDYFRVKVGPSLNKDKAKEMKSKLDKINVKGLIVAE